MPKVKKVKSKTKPGHNTEPKNKPVKKKKYTTNILAIDTETTGLDLHHGCLPYMVTTCNDHGLIKWWEWPVDIKTRRPRIPRKDILEIQALLATTRRYVFHNAKFDVRALQRAGIITNADRILERSEDTSLAAHVLRSDGPINLKDLALLYCQILDDDKDDLKDAVRKARSLARSLDFKVATKDSEDLPSARGSDLEMMDGWLPKALADGGWVTDKAKAEYWAVVCSIYGRQDAERTMVLWHTLYAAIHGQRLTKVYRERQRLLRPTYQMEERGMLFSRERVNELHETLTTQCSHKAEYLSIHGIGNPNSPKQICSCLFESHKLTPPKYTDKGNPSTDAETLEILSQEQDGAITGDIIKSLLEYRKGIKTLQYLSAYLRYAIPKRRYSNFSLHPSYKIPGTKSTRYASSNPNGQNIEKKGKEAGVRSIFGPDPEHVWLSLDYSNIELRIFAYGCQDERLIRAYEEGQSVHLVICKALYPKEFAKSPDFASEYKDTLYQWTKNGNFALIYGASPHKADKTYRLPGAYNKIRKRLPKIDSFIKEKHELVKHQGYITTLGGYRLWVPFSEPHKAVNYYCQGSAGDAMTMALNLMYPYVNSIHGYMIATIHDEVLIEVPINRYKSQGPTIVANLKSLMSSVGDTLGLPLPADCDLITETWAKGEPV